MTSSNPKYIPAPNWDIPADSPYVVLGRLIKDPKNPESCLPKSAVIPIDPDIVQDGTKTTWKTTLDQLRSGSIGLWARCFQVISGSVSFSKLNESVETHEFDHLETKYFVPDEEDHIEAALKDPYVSGFFSVTRRKKPLYIITGIKIARGAKVSAQTTRNTAVEGNLGADLTPAGVPASFGPKADLNKKDGKLVSYEGSTDYVFAYRLTRLKPKGRANEPDAGVSSDEYVGGAVFRRDDEGDTVEAPLREGYEIDDDAVNQELGIPGE